MRLRIKLAYSDFWPDFDRETDLFTRIIRRRFDVEWSDEPDILIYSVFGFKYLQYDCIRIFYTGENVRPDFRDCDFAFSFDYGDSLRSFRLPFYVRRLKSDGPLRSASNPEAELSRKSRFCTFVYTDPSGKRRNAFMTKLSKYKTVDSGGGHLNNIGGRVLDKMQFLREAKFNIAFEHTSYRGYTTEKITDAFAAHAIPIYWGNPLIEREFNGDSFFNVHKFRSDEEAIEMIIACDQDDELYLKMMRATPQPGTEAFMNYQDELLKNLEYIFSLNILPVAGRRHKFRLWDRHIRPAGRRVAIRLVHSYRWGFFSRFF